MRITGSEMRPHLFQHPERVHVRVQGRVHAQYERLAVRTQSYAVLWYALSNKPLPKKFSYCP